MLPPKTKQEERTVEEQDPSTRRDQRGYNFLIFGRDQRGFN